jgi:septal ring factor EnvC (AmiA/AmiB activator)
MAGNKFVMKDFVGAGFKRIDEDKIKQHPPMIQFGDLYGKMSLRERVRYCERLASTMNDAAAKMQDERNELLEICQKQEAQLKAGGIAMTANQSMIQSQILQHNEENQENQAEIARLNARIRELETKPSG